LSNVGISLSINLSIDDQSFALLTYRESENRFMLISGYSDNFQASDSDYDNFWANVIREASEELIVIGGDRLPLRCEMAWQESNKSFTAFDSLTYSDSSFSLNPTVLPAYLRELGATKLLIDGKETKIGFLNARQWNCGQLIFPLELKFPKTPRWIFHSEDKLDTSVKPPMLVSLLSRENLVLCKLDDQGLLTSRFFQLQNGQAVELTIDPGQTWLSEAFAFDRNSDSPWIVTEDRILLSTFLAQQKL